jgi:5,10-methylenetetrahydromethanopterin reductase
MTVLFATGITVRDFSYYREWLAEAERAGFDMIVNGDSQSLWADPFIAVAAAAQATARPRLGIVVSNPVTRHPAVVASSLAALQQLSGDRIVYGVASGDSALRNLGLRSAKVADLEEFATAVKRLTGGQAASYRGREIRLEWQTTPVPVFMAAEGPRTQELAGRIADGVILSHALDPRVFARARDRIHAAAQSAGRDPASIEIWCMMALSFAETEAAGFHAVRFQFAGSANHVYRFGLTDKGVPPDLVPALRELQRRYDSSAHATPERAAANAQLVSELGLTEFLARQSVVAGPVAECAKRIAEIARMGADRFIVSHLVGDQFSFLRAFGAELRPAVLHAVQTSRHD